MFLKHLAWIQTPEKIYRDSALLEVFSYLFTLRLIRIWSIQRLQRLLNVPHLLLALLEYGGVQFDHDDRLVAAEVDHGRRSLLLLILLVPWVYILPGFSFFHPLLSGMILFSLLLRSSTFPNFSFFFKFSPCLNP